MCNSPSYPLSIISYIGNLRFSAVRL